ncbi:MAG: HAD family hydrolase [Verrucomicrobiaceae bacterium]|nr:HAD family hydrolase [Verrucomicrobiaceae bacterium]
MALRALIFDFDGLIIDTESAIYDAWREFYESHGQQLEMATWAQCVGTDFGAYDPKAELESFTGKSFDWKKIDRELEARVRELLTGYEALPGVRELLSDALQSGLPCSVASSSPLSWVEGWLNHLDLKGHFANVSCRDHVQRIKPAPDLFLDAAKKLGAASDEVVIFEDSLNGLRAANAAGMRCITAPGPLTRHLDLSSSWRRVNSLADVALIELHESFA